jgi:hypothetical protein
LERVGRDDCLIGQDSGFELATVLWKGRYRKYVGIGEVRTAEILRDGACIGILAVEKSVRPDRYFAAGRCSRGRTRSSRVRARRCKRREQNCSAAERGNAASGVEKGAVEGIFLSDQADVMLIYCSAVPALQSEMPPLTSIKLPATLTVEPADGMIILDSKPVAFYASLLS